MWYYGYCNFILKNCSSIFNVNVLFIFVNVSLFWIQVEGEGSDLHFNVFHKCVNELGFHKMAVGNNRTITLKNVMIGEEYEVRVSSLELSTGKVLPLSRAVTVGEKMQ